MRCATVVFPDPGSPQTLIGLAIGQEPWARAVVL
jgi:hypothetical protein